MTTFKLCTKAECNNGVLIKILNKDKKVYTYCQTVHCQLCYLIHKGNCDNGNFIQLTKLYKLTYCAKCKNSVQKISGCNQMKCRCGYRFCQNCWQPFQSGHICPTNKQTVKQKQLAARQSRHTTNKHSTKQCYASYLLTNPKQFFLHSTQQINKAKKCLKYLIFILYLFLLYPLAVIFLTIFLFFAAMVFTFMKAWEVFENIHYPCHCLKISSFILMPVVIFFYYFYFLIFQRKYFVKYYMQLVYWEVKIRQNAYNQ